MLLGPPLVEGNLRSKLGEWRRDFSVDARLQFAALSKASPSSRISIGPVTIGREFAEALAARASAGVNVHVLIDWVGSQKMDEQLLDLMRGAGVQVERYHPLRWYHLTRMNNRTHRKLLVIDGTVGFTGGVGIADVWSGHAQDPNHWRDSHYKSKARPWHKCKPPSRTTGSRSTGDVLQGERYFPALAICWRFAGSSLHELAERRCGQHDADVLDGDLSEHEDESILALRTSYPIC